MISFGVKLLVAARLTPLVVALVFVAGCATIWGLVLPVIDSIVRPKLEAHYEAQEEDDE
jgi:hypothetical protein